MPAGGALIGGSPSRVVLRWILGLNLSIPIKNLKRDFVSGYVIAEIFIRYHPSIMSMNGFQNSVSMKAKENNWKLLEKLMKKLGFSYSRNETDGLINGDTQVTIAFMTKMHDFLTRATRPATTDDAYGTKKATLMGRTLTSRTFNSKDLSATVGSGEKGRERVRSSSLSLGIRKEPAGNDVTPTKTMAGNTVDFPQSYAAQLTDSSSTDLQDTRAQSGDGDSSLASSPSPATTAQEDAGEQYTNFTPYTLRDYNLKQEAIRGKYWELGKLGPNLDDRELQEKRHTLQLRKDYGKAARVYNHTIKTVKGAQDDNEDAQVKSISNKTGSYPETVTRREKIQKATAARRKALEYAASVPKPRSRFSEENEEEEQQLLDNDNDRNEFSKLDNLMRKHRLDQERLKDMKIGEVAMLS